MWKTKQTKQNNKKHPKILLRTEHLLKAYVSGNFILQAFGFQMKIAGFSVVNLVSKRSTSCRPLPTLEFQVWQIWIPFSQILSLLPQSGSKSLSEMWPDLGTKGDISRLLHKVSNLANDRIPNVNFLVLTMYY